MVSVSYFLLFSLGLGLVHKKVVSSLPAVCDIRAVLVKVVNMGVISLGVAMFDTVVSLIKLLLNRIIHLTRLVYFN